MRQGADVLGCACCDPLRLAEWRLLKDGEIVKEGRIGL
jgi:hypothetical protein